MYEYFTYLMYLVKLNIDLNFGDVMMLHTTIIKCIHIWSTYI